MVGAERPADLRRTATAIGLAGRRWRTGAAVRSGRRPGAAWDPGGAWDAASRWTDERLAAERARVLRRLGRWTEAAEAWQTAAAAGGGLGVIAWIEVAKLREHRLGDPGGALAATRAAWRLLERLRVDGPGRTRASRRTSSGAAHASRPGSAAHGREVGGQAT